MMQNKNDDNLWVWAVVQDPDGNEQFLGQYNEEQKVSFIPVFPDKEQAERGLSGLAKADNLRYQVQAVRYNEIKEHASKNGFHLYVLEGDGRIIEKVAS